MNRAITAVILFSIFLCGCATAGKVNQLSIGMTKADVIATMGDPVSTSAREGVEYMSYRLSETSNDAFYGIESPYFVKLVNGKVQSYGRTGDFDSTKDPTFNVNVNK